MPDTDTIDFIASQQRFSRANAVLSLNDDPERAARAAELAEATGADPNVVYGDLDNWEAQHKAALTNQIIAGNPRLQDYSNSNPLAAKISNDDWGKLDEVSHRVTEFLGSNPQISSFMYSAKKFMEGAREGFDAEGFKRDYRRLYEAVDNPLWRLFVAANPLLVAPDLTSRVFSGATTGVSAVVGQALTDITGSEAWGGRLARDVNQLIQVGLSGQGGFHLAPELQAAMKLVRSVEPYYAKGKEPPPGLDPVLDEAKAKQALTDAATLEAAEKVAQESATRERSPEAFAAFVRQHTDAKIGVNADMIRALYGEEVPTQGDNLLGWVPDIARKLEVAEAAGGDVEIPLADWLAKVEPDVAKQLRDGIRVRPEGLSPAEAVEPQGIEVYHGSPHEFDAFSLDKIGTGEGAQSYGYGLYFAEEKAVAKEYQTKLATAEVPEHDTESGLWKVRSYENGEMVERDFKSKKAADSFVGNKTGSLYRVRIKARPEQFLDWDLPLDQQTPEVQAALKAAGWDPDSYALPDGKLASRIGGPTGATVIKEAMDKDPAAVSKALLNAGIPGIRFLDQQSRRVADEIARYEKALDNTKARIAAGEIDPSYLEGAEQRLTNAKERFAGVTETRNYVVFSDKILEILDRNGEAVQGVRQAAKLDLPESALAPKAAPTAEAVPAEPQATTPFPTKPGWMSADQYARYLKLIDKRNLEDAAAAQKRAEKEIARRKSQLWKDNVNEVRNEVVGQIDARPDFVVDRFFREGRIGDAKVSEMPKLGREFLTKEQIADLPERYTREGGLAPDDVAALFGYTDGKAMIAELSQLTRDREDSGKNYAAWRRGKIEDEVNRKMEERFGREQADILEEAKEQALSDTQMELLHEDVLAMGLAAGAKFPITRGEFEGWVREKFTKLLVDEVSSDKFLRDAGTAGRRVEDALLKGDIAEAFRQRQRQYIAAMMAKEATKLEREQAKFDKLAKRYAKRESPSLLPEYTNWIHDILMRIGKQVKRSVQDLESAIQAENQGSLREFVEHKEQHDMREMPVADFLLDPAFRKSVDQLTTEEFRALHDSLKTLEKNGRDERKLFRAGEEASLDEVKEKMVEQLRTFAEKHYDAEGKRWLGIIPPRVAKVIRTYLASHLQLESVFNRWDRGDPKEVFTQYVMRGLTEAANYESALEKKFSRMLAAVADKANLREKIDNPLFIDPLSKREGDPGYPMQLTRGNLRAILLNAGNESNLAKLAKGYGVKPEEVMAWLHAYATKEDWQWAQKIGDIFASIKADADVMYQSLSGVAPESIEIKPVDTPHGQFAGWYYPVIYHPVFEGLSKKLMGGNALEQNNYNRATTPRGYTKERTGYAAPVALDIDMMPVRMRQMIHDIAMRPAVINASKIFYDKDVRAAITKHYGVEYREMLVPYLRDVANAANYRSDAQFVGTRVSEFLRQNMIATLIGLNPGTVLKHGPTAAVNSVTEVGMKSFLKAAKGLFSINEATGETNWRFAMDTSEELQRRHRHFNETLGGAQEKVLGQETLRETVIRFGSFPVAISDLLSAVPTWLAKYEDAMAEHGEHGTAVYEADRAVRRAHGSTAVTNRPEVARTGPMGAWLASLYGFFNHIMNRQFELAWKAKDTLGMVREGDLAGAKAHVPELTAGLFSYIIFPALIEELVTPLPDPHHESWGVKAAKGLAFTISSSWIGIRDLASAMLRGSDPSVGLISSGLKSVTDLVRDLKKDLPMSKQHAGALLQHFFTIFGALTGLTNAQEGKTARYIFNYSTGQERPKSLSGIAAGLRFGTSKHHTQ